MASAPETKPTDSVETESNAADSSFFSEFLNPVNLVLTLIIVLLVYKILRGRLGKSSAEAQMPELPKIRKDMTVAELRQFDGTQPDGRVLVAVNGWIFDVTRGRRFYGPGACICL